MKKTFVPVFVVVCTLLFATGAFAGWVLYDNFDKYANIEEMKTSGKWYIDPADETIADFSIVNGRLRIEHLAGNPNDSVWATLIRKPSTIMGIKATIEVESWAGDVRARIGAYVGSLKNNPDHIVWYDMGVRHLWADWVAPAGAWMEFVRGYAGVYDDSANMAWLYDLFYTELGAWKYPTLVGTPYKITAKFDRRNALFQVNVPANLGKVNFAYVEAIGEPEETFRGIGTRSSDDLGTCVAYFDDVYVYRP